MSSRDEADHIEILRTLVKQNETMERMINSFDNLSKRIDHLANLDERMTKLESQAAEEKLKSVAFRTKVNTLSQLGWWAIAAAGASLIGHFIRAIPLG